MKSVLKHAIVNFSAFALLIGIDSISLFGLVKDETATTVIILGLIMIIVKSAMFFVALLLSYTVIFWSENFHTLCWNLLGKGLSVLKISQ